MHHLQRPTQSVFCGQLWCIIYSGQHSLFSVDSFGASFTAASLFSVDSFGASFTAASLFSVDSFGTSFTAASLFSVDSFWCIIYSGQSVFCGQLLVHHLQRPVCFLWTALVHHLQRPVCFLWTALVHHLQRPVCFLWTAFGASFTAASLFSVDSFGASFTAASLFSVDSFWCIIYSGLSLFSVDNFWYIIYSGQSVFCGQLLVHHLQRPVCFLWTTFGASFTAASVLSASFTAANTVCFLWTTLVHHLQRSQMSWKCTTSSVLFHVRTALSLLGLEGNCQSACIAVVSSGQHRPHSHSQPV